MREILVLILGDQLSDQLSSLHGRDPAHTTVLMAEVHAEASYVPHHPKKITLIFSAMRHHAERLRARGFSVIYYAYDSSGPQDLTEALAGHADAFDEVHVTRCGEWRLHQQMQEWQARWKVHILEDTRFLTSPEEFATWAGTRKQLRMEHFYREQRRKTGLLMDGDQPLGGRWNFDADNRKAYTGEAGGGPLRFPPDALTEEVLASVETHFADHFGNARPFWFATTPEQADAAFEHFLSQQLPYFGDYQDAMRQDDDWLFHSVISPYLNIGLLDPLDICQRAEARYHAGHAPLNAVEGFIRQIIGWREYIRGVYWLRMPDYAARNALNAQRPLPALYWDETRTSMNCLRQAVRLTREEAWSHHILRLMVTGNFALLTGVNPQELASWYLAVYADAFEWVELPNVYGMASFADGGELGSKPYAASGKYINRQGDYCQHCAFNPRLDTGPKACPLNSLYWAFIDRHAPQFEKHPRMQMIVRTWHRMAPEKQAALRLQATQFLQQLDSANPGAPEAR